MIFLHFSIILLYNNYIEKKAWKTFNSFKIQILLVCKYNKTGNKNSKTTKRKSRISSFLESLFNFNLGGLFRGAFWGVEVFFEVFEIWYVSTHTYAVSENIPFSTKTLLILLMSAFFCKKSVAFGNNSTLTQSNSVRAVLEFFQFCF